MKSSNKKKEREEELRKKLLIAKHRRMKKREENAHKKRAQRWGYTVEQWDALPEEHRDHLRRFDYLLKTMKEFKRLYFKPIDENAMLGMYMLKGYDGEPEEIRAQRQELKDGLIDLKYNRNVPYDRFYNEARSRYLSKVSDGQMSSRMQRGTFRL